VIILGLCLADRSQAQTTEETDFIRKVFAKIQPFSIRVNREYCGYIGRDEQGNLVATPALIGDESSCERRTPGRLATVVASYHTHAAFSPDFYNEVPSEQDVENDAEDGIDGYVATPGGRLWHIDGATKVVTLVCDLSCLPADPAFDRDDSGPIAKSYTFPQLTKRLEQ
jgi:Domain of unknown function (DUF4329)